jgi:hypothetical protein
MFKWKDRAGAVRQAVYHFIQKREDSIKRVAEMTQAEIDGHRKFFNNPTWTPKPCTDEKNYVECASLVLGTGSSYANYYCVDPENLGGRQWTQFLNDVKREVARRDENKRQIAFLEQMLGEKVHANSSSEV